MKWCTSERWKEFLRDRATTLANGTHLHCFPDYFRSLASDEGNKTTTRKDSLVLLSALKNCCETGELEYGKRIHQTGELERFHSNLAVANTLVNMYRSCGDINEAKTIFLQMKKKSVVTWNCLLLGYVENGLNTEALELFSSMDSDPSHVTYVAALKACIGLKSLENGRAVHKRITQHRLDSNILVASTLLNMYCKCGDMNVARELFNRMPRKDAVTWTCLILGYVDSGQYLLALELFHRMDSEPDYVTFVAAVRACAGLGKARALERSLVLEKAAAVYEMIKQRAFHSNITVSNALVDMYCKIGDMVSARRSFSGLVSKDVVTWNTLLWGYIENGDSLEVLKLFSSISCEPDHLTFVAVIKACTSLASDGASEKHVALKEAICIHKKASRRSWNSHVSVASALVELYSRVGELKLAREVFETVAQKDVVLWNCLIMAYVDNGEGVHALELLDCMDCEPTPVTFTAAVKACLKLIEKGGFESEVILNKGMAIHEQMKVSGADEDTVAACCLVEMYSKLNSLALAKEVFDKAPNKNVVLWTYYILAHVERKKFFEALEVFQKVDCERDEILYVAALKACTGMAGDAELRKEALEKGTGIHHQCRANSLHGNVSSSVATALVSLYGKCGEMKLARAVFDGMAEKDVVAWTCMILGYLDNGLTSAALEVFNTMDCEPDNVTYVAVLKACGNIAAVGFGRTLHCRLCKLGVEQDLAVATTLVEFYGRCGCMPAALQVFNSIQSSSIFSWNALLSGYSRLGDSSQVFTLAKDIVEADLQPDAVTFAHILTACSHGGRVEAGERWFAYMRERGVFPTVGHYTCMVDMLGRANKFEEAAALVRSLPLEADEITWKALLAACRKWNNLEVAELAFERILAANSRHATAACTLMGNIYGAVASGKREMIE